MTRGTQSVLGKRKRGHSSAHFSFGNQVRMAAQIEEEAESFNRHKSHEAHMIPGLHNDRIFGFPNSIITKLRYCDLGSFTSTLGSTSFQVFSANGIFDPDISGVGHQPMWRDNYANIYNSYTVIGSKVTFTVVQLSSTFVAAPWIITVNGDDNSTISTTAATRMESNNAASVLLDPRGGLGSVTLTSTFEPLMAFGVATKDDGASLTTVGTNPAEQWYYGFAGATLDSSTSTVYWKVEIEYTVKFAELASQAQN